jgi:hypothetical protein
MPPKFASGAASAGGVKSAPPDAGYDCVMCVSTFSSVPYGFCSHAACNGHLCEKCYDKHLSGLGRLAPHKGAFQRCDDPSPELLAKLELEMCRKTCSVHTTESLTYVCDTCTAALCGDCIVAHKNHALVLLPEAAAKTRAMLRRALECAPSLDAGVDAIRTYVRLVDAELKALPERHSAAQQVGVVGVERERPCDGDTALRTARRSCARRRRR